MHLADTPETKERINAINLADHPGLVTAEDARALLSDNGQLPSRFYRIIHLPSMSIGLASAAGAMEAF